MFLRSIGILARVLVVLAAALIPACASAATIIGQQTDPQHESILAHLDIVSAKIEQAGGQLTFTIEARGAIPTSLPNPEDVLTYLWFIDTDENGATGQPHGTLGSEFNVRAVVGQVYGGGFVDVTGGEPGGGVGTVVIAGNTISITIWLSQIASPADFDWRCASFGISNGGYVPGNPDTIVTYSETLPYTPPARVTVTTPILELCPTGPETGQIDVVIRDAGGAILPNEEHVITYHSTNDAVATVDQTGLVTAIVPPEFHWQTPYIEVWADGLMADNFSVIRVNSIDVGVTHQSYPSQHVTFWVPPMIEGVNLEAITEDYEIVGATERAYLAQAIGVGTVPTSGGMEYFVLDVANDPETSVCGASGNPIRLGWLYGVPVHNSCYIVNDPANRVPQWFVLWHEMGHNFTSACYAFNLFCMGPSGPHNAAYSEGLASLAATWSRHMVLAKPQGLGPMALNDIEQHFSNYESVWRQDLVNYKNAGPDYDTMDANVLDGILLELHDQYGMDLWFDLFSTFLPPDAPLPVTIDTKEKQATWFVAAVSVSAGEDLRGFFATEYGFPIDDAFWAEIEGMVEERIAARSWVPVGVEEEADIAVDSDRILMNAPNPFKDNTTIRFLTTGEGRVGLSIHSVCGSRVATILERVLPAGEHTLYWDGRDTEGHRVASGAYLARLVTAARISERKLIVVR